MRHKSFETFEQSAGIGNYRWEFTGIPFLGVISITDRLKPRDEEVLYTSELDIADNICYMAYFKRRGNTKTNATFLPFSRIHHSKGCSFVSGKSLIKSRGFPYVVGLCVLSLKQRIHSPSLSFCLKQCFIKWNGLGPFNLETFYRHNIILGGHYCCVNTCD